MSLEATFTSINHEQGRIIYTLAQPEPVEGMKKAVRVRLPILSRIYAPFLSAWQGLAVVGDVGVRQVYALGLRSADHYQEMLLPDWARRLFPKREKPVYRSRTEINRLPYVTLDPFLHQDDGLTCGQRVYRLPVGSSYLEIVASINDDARQEKLQLVNHPGAGPEQPIGLLTRDSSEWIFHPARPRLPQRVNAWSELVSTGLNE